MDTAVLPKIDKQLAGLRRGPGNPKWKKGVPSPNPKGRSPKPFCMSDALRELQVGNPPDVIAKWKKKGELTGAQRSAVAMQHEIEKGNVQAFNQVADRVEGKVTDHTDVTSKGESLNHTTIEVTSDKAKEATELILSGKIEQCVN